jgi:hypothetical protein
VNDVLPRVRRLVAGTVLVLLVLTGSALASPAKLYPVNRTVVKAACKGGYANVAGSHGAIHYTFTKTTGTCSFSVRSKGFEFIGIIVITKPQPCLYRIAVTVTHAGKVLDREPIQTVRSCL